MTYRNLLEVAEAVFDGRVDLLSPEQIGWVMFMEFHPWHDQLKTFFPGYGMAGNGHRMWFCLFVHEAMK